MPAVITFDIKKASRKDRNRIQGFFERLGWENLGGSSYRYPKLGFDHPTEDWFNHVIPALMLLRSFILSNSTARLTKFTLDVQSSTGYNPKTSHGTPPLNASKINVYPTERSGFGEKNLKNWLDNVKYPY